MFTGDCWLRRVAWDQMGDFDSIQGRQAVETLHRNGPLASLVGSEHGRTKFLLGTFLYLLQRPAPVTTSSPQTLAQCLVEIVQIPAPSILPKPYHREWSV